MSSPTKEEPMSAQNRSPVIVAKLDLSDEHQRIMHDCIRRTHSGRWPLWRALAMRQVGPYIFEAAYCQSRSRRASRQASFCLLRWEPMTCAVKWYDMPSRRAALAALKAAADAVAPTLLHAA
jgi:hypothetical protein